MMPEKEHINIESFVRCGKKHYSTTINSRRSSDGLASFLGVDTFCKTRLRKIIPLPRSAAGEAGRHWKNHGSSALGIICGGTREISDREPFKKHTIIVMFLFFCKSPLHLNCTVLKIDLSHSMYRPFGSDYS